MIASKTELILPVALAILVGGAGGVFASALNFPLPYLIGSFAFSIVFAVMGLGIAGVQPALPMPLRNLFVAVIGVMIGGAFSPELLGEVSTLWLPALAMIGFVGCALSVNFFIFRRIGGFDRVTAFFSAMPGGLIESIASGESAGGDVQKLSLQQFLRISLVITIVPTLFQMWTGEPVGSAAGMKLDSSQNSLELFDLSILILCAIAGLYVGKLMRIPAGILVGPLILSAVAHSTGLTSAGFPGWVIALAQVIVGAGIGMRFKGYVVQHVFSAFGLALLSVSSMLVLSVVFAAILSNFSRLPFDVLFISFAPGGVTETALIALSLSANPVVVTTLHIFRIVLTVGVISLGRTGCAKLK